MLQIELDTSACPQHLMDAVGALFAAQSVSNGGGGGSGSASGDGAAGNPLYDFPLTFTIRTNLILYRERFSGRRSPIADGKAVVLEVDAVGVLDENTQTSTSSPTRSSTPALSREESVLIRFSRTPNEFKHLLETLALVFPSLLLPRWPAVALERFPAEILPARHAMAAFLQVTLNFLGALDDVVSHECFLSFVDHSSCPKNKYHLMKVKRRLLEDEHPLGCVQLHDRALQPLTANAGKQLIAAATAAAGTVSGDAWQQLHVDTCFLRDLMASLQAFQAECQHVRIRLQKELTDRQQRRKSGDGSTTSTASGGGGGATAAAGLLSSMFSSKLCTLADLSAIIAKAGGGKAVDEALPHATVRIGDRICSTAFGHAMTGVVSYLGPKTAKKSERLVGIAWDEPLPYASSGSGPHEKPPSSPPSPGATLLGGHWSGSPDTGGKFACRRDQGSIQRSSQIFRDPCEDVTIAAILETCVHVDRCLNPPERGPYGTLLITRNGAWVVGALAAVTNFEAAATQWCSRILTSYRAFVIAKHWIAAQQDPAASPATQQHTSAHHQHPPHPFDLASIRQHVSALGSALSHCMMDFRSAWACYGSARRMNHTLVAERFVALVNLFDHVEPNLFGGSWLLSRACGMLADGGAAATPTTTTTCDVAPAAQQSMPIPSRRAGFYGRGTLDGVVLEVDAELGHLTL